MNGGGVFVARQDADGDARCADLGGDLLGPLAIAAMDHHLGALLGEHARNAFTDPSAASRNERAPPFQLQIHVPSVRLLADSVQSWTPCPM